jgi:glutaredoxin
MKIKFYSNGCPKCRILKHKLTEKGLEYEETDETKPLKDKGILSFPATEIKGEILDYYNSVKYVNSI